MEAWLLQHDPVGATNVGSIRIHFDKGLATNTVYENEIPVSDTASINSTDSGGSVESSKSVKIVSKSLLATKPLIPKRPPC